MVGRAGFDSGFKSSEVETGFEPVYAALQAAASPLGHSTVKAVKPSERMTGLEPATSTLARLRSTN